MYGDWEFSSLGKILVVSKSVMREVREVVGKNRYSVLLEKGRDIGYFFKRVWDEILKCSFLFVEEEW